MKRRKWLCILLCCGLLLTTIAACGGNGGSDEPDPTPAAQETPTPTPQPTPSAPSAQYVLDFTDMRTDYMRMNRGTPGTDRDSDFAIVDLDGVKALSMMAPNGGSIRLGINVGGLLGNRVTDVRTIVFDIYAEYPDGNFSAVSGRITAMTVDTTTIGDTSWQIYLASRNPNQAILEFDDESGFSAEGPSLIEFSCTTNGPADRGETPAVIYLKSVVFYDKNNEAIEINTEAVFEAPEGYGEVIILGGWRLPYPPDLGNTGDWQTWHTPGVDNIDDEHMPWEILAASFGIAFEMEEKPESFGLVVFGMFNGWSSPNWGNNYAENWDDGILTIMWEDYGFDPKEVNEDNDQVKISFGNWDGVDITLAYLLYDEDAIS